MKVEKRGYSFRVTPTGLCAARAAHGPAYPSGRSSPPTRSPRPRPTGSCHMTEVGCLPGVGPTCAQFLDGGRHHCRNGHTHELPLERHTQWYALSVPFSSQAVDMAPGPMVESCVRRRCALLHDKERARLVKEGARAGRPRACCRCRSGHRARSRATRAMARPTERPPVPTSADRAKGLDGFNLW